MGRTDTGTDRLWGHAQERGDGRRRGRVLTGGVPAAEPLKLLPLVLVEPEEAVEVPVQAVQLRPHTQALLLQGVLQWQRLQGPPGMRQGSQ